MLDQDRDYARGIERANRAVMFADIVESVRLVEQDEERVLARWLQFIAQVESEILPACNGRLVKGLGDGLLAEFGDVQSAIAAAFAVQHASHRENHNHPPERRLLLRMGMEVCDVIVDSRDVYGRGVNLAARLMSLAGPGEIVVSANVRDRLIPYLDADVEDLGDCYLRHLEQPVRAYRVGPPGPQPVMAPTGPIGDLTPSLAVVPFAARDVAPEHRVLGEVLAEEIIREFSLSRELSVISRLSTTGFRDRGDTAELISAHLKANYVLSGWYRIDGDTVTVDTELAEAKSGQIVWIERLADKLPNILRGDRELIGRAVAGAGAAVIARELQRAQSQPLPTLKNYSLLLGAIALMHRLCLPDFETARHYLETLIDRGPHQAIPHAWLANWHVLRVQQGWSAEPKIDAYTAHEHSKKALDLDPSCSLALAIDGFVHTNLLRQLDDAEDCYALAIEANPNEPLAWLLKGTLHAFRGEGELAVNNTERARRISPLDPHHYFYDALAAGAYIAAGDNPRAVELAKRSLRANRTHTSTLRILAVGQWRLGDEEKARATAKSLLKMQPKMTVSGWLQSSPSGAYPVGKEFAETLRDVGVPK